MPDTPRTWTLYREKGTGQLNCAPQYMTDEIVEVVEKAPVDIERERMAALVEAVKDVVRNAYGPELRHSSHGADYSSDCMACGIDALTIALGRLHEHNRLPKWEQPNG